jgi:hypothetical protein
MIMSRVYADWAEFVSNVVSPPVVWSILAFPIAALDAPSTSKMLTWAMIYVVLVSAAPTLYILLQVRRGNIADMHMPNREERIRPFIVSIITTSIAVVVLYVSSASPIMRLFAISSLIQLTLMALITTMWQISIHMISISGVVVTVGALFGATPVLLTAPLVPLVALARLKLHRHTRAQVIAGIILGALSVSALLVMASNLEPGLFSHH